LAPSRRAGATGAGYSASRELERQGAARQMAESGSKEAGDKEGAANTAAMPRKVKESRSKEAAGE